MESTLLICPSQSSRRRVVVVDESRPSLLGSTHDKLPHGARGGEGCARDKEAAYSPIASPGEEWFSLHLQMWAPRRASVPRRTRAGCGLCNGTAVHYHLCPCVHRAAPASCTVCDAACARFYAPHRLRRCAVACIPLLRSALPHAFSALRTTSLPLTRQTCSAYEIIMRYLTSSIVAAVCTPPPLPPPPLPLPSLLPLPSINQCHRRACGRVLCRHNQPRKQRQRESMGEPYVSCHGSRRLPPRRNSNWTEATKLRTEATKLRTEATKMRTGATKMRAGATKMRAGATNLV